MTDTQLPETLRRLSALIEEQGLNRSKYLSPKDLAEKAALPEETVRTLLRGGIPPADSVNERVSARIKTLADAYLVRKGKRMSDLAAEIHERLGVSDYWARQVCDGKKVPSVELLYGLVEFFDVPREEGETFFTLPAADALNRLLLPVIRELENPDPDPVQALMKKYGLVDMDLRRHGSMTRAQLERLLRGVIQSVLPQEEDGDR
ncbi:hypothetical protein AB0945_43925 [Streptomyces sp. NPDC005474]|uniref:hypothetical protein n=1 Tax=Streptomyces sp. NPDC005474 TaxID=3154878 RepID=UPI0034514D75